MPPEVERRARLELRLKGDKPEARTIEGYAAVFNSLSEELWGFREMILPGAFDRALAEGHDVRALVNHDPNRLLGRTKSGTLRLSVDDRGLQVEIDPPDTQTARDTLASIERGDLDGMSFAFSVEPEDESWRKGEDGMPVREIRSLNLVDVSIVAYPAYPITEVSARALESARATVVTPPEPGVPNEVNEARLKMAAK